MRRFNLEANVMNNYDPLFCKFIVLCFLRQLQHGELSAELLQRNLHYVTRISQAIFVGEIKKFLFHAFCLARERADDSLNHCLKLYQIYFFLTEQKFFFFLLKFAQKFAVYGPSI